MNKWCHLNNKFELERVGKLTEVICHMLNRDTDDVSKRIKNS